MFALDDEHRPSSSLPTQRFVAHDFALQAAASCLALARGRTWPADLSSQVTRAAASVALNLGEGAVRSGQDHHYRIAYGSALEASTGIELLVATGVLDRPAAQPVLNQLDRVRAMVWRLLHPRGGQKK